MKFAVLPIYNAAVAKKIRVLLVDDEAIIRKTLPLVLQQKGFEVTSSATVQQALQQIQENRFDVLICDLNIGRYGDGYEVSDAMRIANPHCLRIILTGYPDLSSAVEGIHHGIDDYITKPSDIDGLIASVTEKLRQRTPKARILCVSQDQLLLRMREMLLEREGYEVVSTLGVEAGLAECKKGDFDLFVLGHSIDYPERQKLVDEFRRSCAAPILCLRRNMGEQPVDGAEFHIEPDPEMLLQTIERILRKRKQQ